MSDLYKPEGWLNFGYIKTIPAPYKVIIGKRQVGKTYGALETMLDENLRFILLRRTTKELKFISASPELNPFNVFEPKYKTALFREGDNLCRICDYELDENGKATPKTMRGLAMSLTEIASIRGFNGLGFTDLVFDEFIPEKGVIVRKTEGESFLNAYTTINGNRELKGLPPLNVWLLANSNRIDSPILSALNLDDEIMYMRRKGLEELYLPKRGVYIVQPDSRKVTEAREDTALMRLIDKRSDFYKMAMENEFAYDDSPFIGTLPLKGMTPVWNYNNKIYCWKRSKGFYICRAPGRTPNIYTNSRRDKEKLALDFEVMVNYYYGQGILFSDIQVLSIFKQIFGIT